MYLGHAQVTRKEIEPTIKYIKLFDCKLLMTQPCGSLVPYILNILNKTH